MTSVRDATAIAPPSRGSARAIAVSLLIFLGLGALAGGAVLVARPDGSVLHKWQVTPGGHWSPWGEMGHTLKSIAVARNRDGRLEIFGANTAHTIYHEWQELGAPKRGNPWFYSFPS